MSDRQSALVSSDPCLSVYRAEMIGLLKKMKKKKASPPTGDKGEGDKKTKDVKEAVAGAKKVEKDKMAMPPPAVAKATPA